MVGELPDLWDFMVGDWEFDSITSRFADEGVPGAVRARPEGADLEAGGRRRPLHLAGHDGADGARRGARPDRRGPAVDRRPVPAEEDRGGPARGHPRVHRLQHLRLRRRDHDADPLHPEPDHGRGVAARLASRADPAEGQRRQRAGRRRRAGGARGGAVRSASAATTSCWPRPPASSAAGSRARPPARAGGLDPGASTTARPAASGCRTSRSAFGSESPPARCSSTASTTSPSRPAPLARRRRRPLAHTAPARDGPALPACSRRTT